MAFQLVSLLVALLAAPSWSQFPSLQNGFGGFPGQSSSFGNPFGPMVGNRFAAGAGGFNNGFNQQQQQVDPNLLTCIGADVQDLSSQIRLTLRPLNPQQSGPGPMGFGGLGNFGQNKDQPQDWSVDGVLLTSQMAPKLGSYQVGVFEGGRTFGKCKMSALGQVINSAQQGGLGGPFGMPGGLYGGFRGFGSQAYGGMFGNQQPNGVMSNNAVVSTGNTMYSSMVRGVSYNQLVGRSIAVCQIIQGGQCYGSIPYCCSIVSDSIPASEVFVEPITGTQQLGIGQGLIGGQSVIGGGGIVGGLGGMTGLGGQAGTLGPAGLTATVGSADNVNIGGTGIF